MAEESGECPAAAGADLNRADTSAGAAVNRRDHIEAAKATLVGYLRDKGKATNREMIDLLGGDKDLFEQLREALILDEVADDRKGVGLVCLAPPTADTAPPLSESQAQRLRVFLSYPHDEFSPVAERMRQDLERRGHEVWFDCTELHPGQDWELAIENGLEWVASAPERGVVILIMTPHSVQRPDGYCLNEVTFAVIRRIRIVPVMLVDVAPPLSITRVQWLDLRDCVPIHEREACYQRKLPVLLSALESNLLDFQGAQARLLHVLKPADYEKDVEYHLPRFIGRKWLFRRLEDWLVDPHGRHVFWISGGPGSGKSAVAAWICARRSEVAAYHFCRFFDRLKADPTQAVRSIAWQLSTQIPGYFARLVNIPNLEEACSTGDAATLFDLLVVQPLHNLPPPDHIILLVIDALDEAARLGRNELAQFLVDETERLPDWVRLLVTSRPELEVTQHLEGLEPLVLSADSPENTADIAEYIRIHIASRAPGGILPPATVGAVLEASRQNWLYIDWMRRELEAGRLSLTRPDQFPKGLGGVYCRFLQRRVPDLGIYCSRCRPFLEVVAAACEPLLIEDLARVLGWSKYTLYEVLRTFGTLFDHIDGRVRAFHGSVMDWLLDPDRAGDYFVDVMAGHRVLAEAGWSEFGHGAATMSEYMKRWLPAHLEATGRLDELTMCVTDTDFLRIALAEGRHLELSRFWGDAASPQFARRCEDSYDRSVQERRPDEQLYQAARATGELFQACGVYHQAIVFLEKALETALDGDDADRIGFARLAVGWCYRHTEEFERAIQHVDAASNCFHAIGNKGGEGRAQSIKGICLWHLHQDLPAFEALGRARDLCADAHDDRGEAEALNHLGIVHRGLGQYKRALECLHRTEAFYTKIKDLRGLGKCCNSLGTAYWWAKEYEKALEYYGKADDYNRRTNQHYVAGLTANNLGYLYLEKGQYEEARAAFARGRAIRHMLGTEGYEMMDVSGLALASHYVGDAETARRLSKEALDGLRVVPSIEDQVRAYYNHYVIFKDGGVDDAKSAAEALSTAKEITAERLGRIDDPTARSEFVAGVPLVRELVT